MYENLLVIYCLYIRPYGGFFFKIDLLILVKWISNALVWFLYLFSLSVVPFLSLSRLSLPYSWRQCCSFLNQSTCNLLGLFYVSS